MRPLIDTVVVQKLIGGTGVVNLIKVGGVPPARLAVQRILLFQQLRRIGLIGGAFIEVFVADDRYIGDDIPLHIFENQLIQH